VPARDYEFKIAKLWQTGMSEKEFLKLFSKDPKLDDPGKAFIKLDSDQSGHLSMTLPPYVLSTWATTPCTQQRDQDSRYINTNAFIRMH